MRRRAIAAAPRAPGASVGDSSSTLASPRAACDQWRGRAFAGDARSDGFEKGGAGGRNAATDDDAPDAEGQGERSDRSGQVVGHPVGDLDRDRRRRRHWRGRRPRRSDGATGRCVRPAAIASSAWRPIAGPAAIVSRQPRSPHAQTTPSGSATTWPTSPAKPLSPRSSGPSRTMPAEMPVPIARKATLAGAWADPSAELLAQPQRRRAGVVLDEGRDAQLAPASIGPERQVGDAQVDGHADRARPPGRRGRGWRRRPRRRPAAAGAGRRRRARRSGRRALTGPSARRARRGRGRDRR